MRAFWLLIAGCTFSASAFGALYKHVDDAGTVTYSDRPKWPNQDALQLPPPNVATPEARRLSRVPGPSARARPAMQGQRMSSLTPTRLSLPSLQYHVPPSRRIERNTPGVDAYRVRPRIEAG